MTNDYNRNKNKPDGLFIILRKVYRHEILAGKLFTYTLSMRWNIAGLYDLAEQYIPDDRVAIYMPNCAEYAEAAVASKKRRADSGC